MNAKGPVAVSERKWTPHLIAKDSGGVWKLRQGLIFANLFHLDGVIPGDSQ